MVLFYGFEENQGTTIGDGSSGSHDATIYSGSSNWTGSVPPISGNAVYSTTNIANPASVEAGGDYKYILKQKGLGSITFGDKFKFPSGTPPVVTQELDAVDVLVCTSDGINLYCDLDLKDCK